MDWDFGFGIYLGFWIWDFGFEFMLVFPAVDIQGGKGVRLYQGDFAQKKVYADDPLVLAKRWEGEGAEHLHLVDLDGARLGSPENRDQILRIRKGVRIPIQVGGGIRTREDARVYLEAGIDRIILGTVVFKFPERFQEINGAYPGRVAVGIDAAGGKVKVEGWQELTEVYAWDLAQKVKGWGGSLIIFTDINRDGTLGGPDLQTYKKFAENINMKVIVAGGISKVEHVQRIKGLENLGIFGLIIGKALYEKTIDLKEAIQAAK
jgi:phosphoribosylformimino-5-aminoimidazole carboxamide ribotide isomerase